MGDGFTKFHDWNELVSGFFPSFFFVGLISKKREDVAAGWLKVEDDFANRIIDSSIPRSGKLDKHFSTMAAVKWQIPATWHDVLKTKKKVNFFFWRKINLRVKNLNKKKWTYNQVWENIGNG